MQTYKPYSGPSLAPRISRSGRPVQSAVPPPESPSVVAPLLLQNFEQMLVNEALVATIFQCEATESALRISATRNELLAHQRLARAIYDHLGQDLRALRTDIAVLHARTARHHAALHDRVDAALGTLDRAIDSVRQLGAEHLPNQLD